MDMDASDWIAVASAALALLSLVANGFLVRRQLRIEAENLRASVDGEKLRWLEAVLGVFAESAALVLKPAPDAGRPTSTRSDAQIGLAQRLSALADQGRLYFPNFDPEARGQNNLSAYRGARQPVLDAVILAYDLMRCLHRVPEQDRPEVADLLTQCRRLLVSDVQTSIDPRRREQLIEGLTQRTAKDRGKSQEAVAAIVARMRALPLEKVSFD